MSSEPLRHIVPTLMIRPDFFRALSQLKLEVDRLEETEREIFGTVQLGLPDTTLARVRLDNLAFEEGDKETTGPSDPRNVVLHGTVLNLNTIEEFKRRVLNAQTIIDSQGAVLWDDLLKNPGEPGNCWDDPSRLGRFHILCHANIKKHKYTHLGFFPVVSAQHTCRLVDALPSVSTMWLEKRNGSDQNRQCIYAIHPGTSEEPLRLQTLAEWRLENAFLKDRADLRFVYGDYGGGNTAVPIVIRNFLAMLHVHMASTEPLTVTIYGVASDGTVAGRHVTVATLPRTPVGDDGKAPVKITGVEKNEKGLINLRTVDLSSVMDATQLAKSAAELNLRLMRWRLYPDLALEKLAGCKCLLVGSGTLGCNIARNLIGWGVTHVTLIDNGKVSFSNPVRQSLFTHDDAVKGKAKAEAAADRLREILPTLNSVGHTLAIPMPGHGRFDPAEQPPRELDAMRKFDDLVASHDVIFLLTDSRESRWLPTVAATHHNKLCITAAMGFESFLVMRHGVRKHDSDEQQNLGCYFCSEVVAPTDSVSDRSLDQQCTVSRPGLSQLAASLAVELWASVWTHPQNGLAPANDDGGQLSRVPHQLRGRLGDFSTAMIHGEANPMCVACSPKIRDVYAREGLQRDELLIEVLADSSYLESLSGISTLHASAADLDWVDDGDDDDFGTTLCLVC
eukprot:Clim_evm5s218 gene=Clim_evmTU5s218